MKTFQRLLGMLLVVVASAGLMVACGGGEGEECIDSNDCAAGERCNLDTGECGFACDSADDPACIDGEVCDLNAGDGGGVCVGDGTTNPECEIDEDCPTDGDVCESGVCVPDEGPACTENEDCTDEQVCVEGVCETPGTGTDYQYAEIEDVSDTNDAALCDVSDPGSDLFGVELIRDGQSYWARYEAENIVIEGNDHTSASGIIDGSAPDLAGQCPESFSGNIVALGCGGSLFVQFMNDQDQVVYIEDGDTIRVHEWGATCQTDVADSQDQWQVNVCAAGSDLTNAECAQSYTAGSGTGIADVTVSLP